MKLLNGGRKKWELESRELTQEVPSVAATDFTVSGKARPEIRALRDEVLGKVGKVSLVDVRSSKATGLAVPPESVTDFDLTQLYDASKSINEGAITIPGYSMDGWYGRIFRGCGFFDADKPIRKFTKKELHALLHAEPTKIKVDGINLTYAGLIPTIQKSFLSKDVDALQPHVRAFVDRVVTFTACPECGGTRLNEAARSSRIEGANIADACAMQVSDLAEWTRALDEPSVAPLLAATLIDLISLPGLLIVDLLTFGVGVRHPDVDPKTWTPVDAVADAIAYLAAPTSARITGTLLSI